MTIKWDVRAEDTIMMPKGKKKSPHNLKIKITYEPSSDYLDRLEKVFFILLQIPTNSPRGEKDTSRQ